MLACKNQRSLETTASSAPHFALLPSAGMGHLNHFLRLALSYRPATATSRSSPHNPQYPTPNLPTSPHSSLLTQNQPHNLPTRSPSTIMTYSLVSTDIRRSIHLIIPLIQSASPPFSAIVADISIAASVARVVLPELKLKLQSYILSVTSAKFLSLVCYLPKLISEDGSVDFEKKEDPRHRRSSLPSPFFIPGNSFVMELVDNGKLFSKI